MPTAQIQALIEKQDVVEIVRDQIAGILLLELDAQQALAAADATKDPRNWSLRVLTEASNPWEGFRDPPEPGQLVQREDYVPIVNVWFGEETFDRGKSDLSRRQHADATFNIDCYGYGLSRPIADGHQPGDMDAALEAQRAARLVRNILMASSYVTLGLTKIVSDRWMSTIKMLAMPHEARNATHIGCARLALDVAFSEYAPQYQGQPFEGATITVKRQETGQVFLSAYFPAPAP